MPQEVDLVVNQGGTYRRPITIYEPDDSVFDLDTATVWLTVKDRADRATDDDDALIKLYWVSGGASSGLSVGTPASGELTVTMTPAQTDALAVGGQYRYDVKTMKATKVDYPIAGRVIVARVTTERTTTP